MKRTLAFLFATILVVANHGLVAQDCPEADHTVTAGMYYYSPENLVVTAGESIAFVNVQGYHDVNGLASSTGQAWNNPETFYINPVSGSSDGVCIGTVTLTTPGTYNYDCSIGNHAANGMVGTIVVEAAAEGNACQDADHTVTAGMYYYSPENLVVTAGESIAFVNVQGYHDVNGLASSTGQAWNNPETFYINPVSGSSDGVCIGTVTLTNPGTYNYDCSIGNHAANGMVGTIIVEAAAEGTAIQDCPLFDAGPNENWPHALTVTTPASGNSGDEQVVAINVTSLPSGGANYRVVKTVANGNWNNGNANPLVLGLNTITVSAVAFDRSVKVQFSDGEVEFDTVDINGNGLTCGGAAGSGTAVSQCSLFADGPNDTWPYAYTVTTPESGTSGAEQVIELNVTYLPEGGADYRIVKTVANGNWNNGNAFALELGMNTITVSEVAFDRSVKLQIGSGEVEFDALLVNGADQECAGASGENVAIADCSLFGSGPNETWPFAFTVTTPDSPDNQAEQVIDINVTSLPSGGADYRIVKTVANGNWDTGSAFALALGLNTVTVPAVAFDRSVKLQFTSGDVEFNYLAVNGELEVCAGPSEGGVAVSACAVFTDGPNDSWPHALTVTTPESSTSNAEQVIEMNVTLLPEGGADYRIVKTVANGNWFNGNAMALVYGVNTITVSAVDFDRSVKLQLSSGDVEFDALSVNGEDVSCSQPCTDVDEDGICDDVDDCVGALDDCGVCNGPGAIYDCGCSDFPAGACDCDGNVADALGVCGGDCSADINDNGICDTEESGASIYCGEGTTWNPITLKCEGSGGSCPTDLDDDGSTAVGDLLIILGSFGQACE